MRAGFFPTLAVVTLALTACGGEPEPQTAPDTQSKDGQLTLEALNTGASLSGPNLRGLQISPDGRLVTTLQGRENNPGQLDLWAYDVDSGESYMLVSSTELTDGPVELSEEEKNRRERQRIYAGGIVEYQWATDGNTLLFPVGGDVFLYDLETSTPFQITDTDAFETDARLSPRGRYVSYVRDDELYVFDRVSERERRMTRGAGDGIRHAVSEFVAQEELDRDTGYWWSPDERYVAYLRVDETPIAITQRTDISADGITTLDQRYPFAGTDNADVRLMMLDVASGKSWPVHPFGEADGYYGDVYWSKNAEQVYATWLARDHQQLDLVAMDPRGGDVQTLVSDTSDTWIDLNHSFRALEGGGFIWGSERSGFHHLYLYSADGELVRALTDGDWLISGLNCLDTDNGAVYVTGWRDDPLQRHIYRVDWDSGDVVQISNGEGWHSASFAGDCSAYIGSFSSDAQPTQRAIYDNQGERLSWLIENSLDDAHPYAPYLASHVIPEYGTFEAEDGTTLYYQIWKPENLSDPAPAIQLVYGGPTSQTVRKRWGNLFAQYLVDQGYVVFRVDNRGSEGRGQDFQNHIYQKMGQIEVVDQAAGARMIGALDYVDAENIGVYGWSYGGYMTLMMLAQHPDLYAAGIAGAPVTKWELYDTAYTERYMNLPGAYPDAYDAASVFTYLDGIEDDALLLIHGMADDNVIFLNSVMLMEELHKNGTQFELMTYPGEKHGFRATHNRLHRDNLMIDFFDRRLKD